MASTEAPRERAKSTVRLVSVVVPLWLIAITSVSDMSSCNWNPDSSVAGNASTCTRRSTSVCNNCTKLRPAIAAVPCPITRMRAILPADNASITCCGTTEVSSEAKRFPSRSPILPRNVLRKLAGASPISFAKKCLCSPRSMSRVVTSAIARLDSFNAKSVPS